MTRAAVIAAAAVLAHAAPAAAAAPTPGGSWAHIQPAKVGLDGKALRRIAATAQAGHSNCLVVTRDAKIAGEWFFNGTNTASAQDVFSVTKSVTSTLVGIAQDDGDLKIGDSASKWIPEWQGTPAAAVTVRDLLSNDSGREWSVVIDYSQLLTAPDQTAFAVGLQQSSPPGSVWAYNNSAIQTLQRVLAGATHQDVVNFAQRRLFGPLGMKHSRMSTDATGHALTYEGVRSTCEDMARFGTLYLHDGTWGKKQIVSAKWVNQATGRSSTPLNAAYGYLWWLNQKGHIAANPLVATSISDAANPQAQEGRLVPDAPADLFWALGLGNQIVQVDPGSGTVVVRLGAGIPRPTPPTFGPAEASRVVTDAVKPAR